MKTRILLLSFLIICTFYNCSSIKNPKITTEKFTYTPNINGSFKSYKIDKTLNQNQRVLDFLRQKGRFNIKETVGSEDIKITNALGSSGMNGTTTLIPLVFLNKQEILSPNSNSLYRIQNMYLSQFDEIFISKGTTSREIHLYTKTN